VEDKNMSDELIKITPSTFLVCLMSLYVNNVKNNYLLLANDAIEYSGKYKLRELMLKELNKIENASDFFKKEYEMLEEIYRKTFWM